MKSKAPKSHSSSSHSHSSKPFFTKSGEGSFFSKSKETEQPFFSPFFIQSKLTIGQPDDIYEQEADQMADQVVQRLKEPLVQAKTENNSTSKGNLQPPLYSMPAVQRVPFTITPIQRKCSKCGGEMKENEHDEFQGKEKSIQRKPIFESAAPPEEGKSIQRKCAKCDTEKKLQTKPEGKTRPEATNLESQLNSSKGSGIPLSDATRSSMENTFGTNFSKVRIHTNSSAVQMSKTVGAQAFTHGSDIYFNEGKYDPSSSSGQHLLAHELTHTVQQGATKKIQRAQPEDVKITGKHAKASQYTDRVFFDQNGTIPDAVETKKIEDYCHALVKGGTTRIKIIGYSSEEGSDSQNKVYITARLDAVEAIIKVAEPGLTVERESNVNKGTGEIDYRFWRKVRMVKGVTKIDKISGKTVKSYDISEAEASHKIPTSTEEDCELNHKTEYKKHWSSSLTLAENRIDKTILELTTNYATMKPSMKLLFNDDSPKMQKKLIDNLGKIKAQLSNYKPKANHNCATSINSGCDKSTAYNVLSGKSAKMTLCDTFWGNTPDEQAHTLTHEAVHGTTDIQGKDHSYGHVRMIAALSTKDALNNPDSYTYLIRRAYSSTAPIGKNPADTFTGMTPDEEKKVQVTLANLEVWLVNAYQISSQAYSDFHAGGGGVSNWVRSKASSGFNLTPYPNAISEGDKLRMAAIHDRYLTMRSLFMGSKWGPVTKTGPLSITKSSNFSWAAGPGHSVEVNDGFFKKNAYDRVRALMIELLKATPGISSGLQWAYVQLADDIRYARKISTPKD
jgi:hypothetical protein